MPIKDYETVLVWLKIVTILLFRIIHTQVKKLLPDFEAIIKPLDYEVSKTETPNLKTSFKSRACRISSLAHIRAMKSVKPGMYEYQLEAEYVQEFMSHGARACAYPSSGGEKMLAYFIITRIKIFLTMET